MQIHQKLTVIGFVLLVVTYLLFNYNETDAKIGLSYAYVTGISMLIVFITSFVLFGMNRIKESKSKK